MWGGRGRPTRTPTRTCPALRVAPLRRRAPPPEEGGREGGVWGVVGGAVVWGGVPARRIGRRQRRRRPPSRPPRQRRRTGSRSCTSARPSFAWRRAEGSRLQVSPPLPSPSLPSPFLPFPSFLSLPSHLFSSTLLHPFTVVKQSPSFSFRQPRNAAHFPATRRHTLTTSFLSIPPPPSLSPSLPSSLSPSPPLFLSLI